ncbi:hypothetical protein GBAR_LOCUS28061 [Geodia barretti]|uniref:Phosphatase and actin regulator n=1 Tax=Geodia barretti TaxID=519541 RepID=A0AA35TP88_GEOBA|nr:hypothetical protein GBAR_LOCUS28061 [Geodia barretti]
MAANDRQSSPTDFLLELTSPQSSVDTSTQDRMTVQQELEKKLRARAVREDLVQKNILPDFSSSPILFQQTKELQKKKVYYTTYYVLRVLFCPTSLSVYNMHNTAHVSCLCALVGFSLSTY